MDFSSAYALCVNGLWYRALSVRDCGDFVDIATSSYQSIQARKSSIDAIKINQKADTFVGTEHKFDLEVV